MLIIAEEEEEERRGAQTEGSSDWIPPAFVSLSAQTCLSVNKNIDASGRNLEGLIRCCLFSSPALASC